MKKGLITTLCIVAISLGFASCDVKQSKEYQALKRAQDSLALVNDQTKMELNEMIEVINEVEENFSRIKEAEKYLTVESKIDGKLSVDAKEKIKGDFAMIQGIMEKNKSEIARLNQRVKNSTGEVAGLKKTIERLNAELEERAKTITELQASLQKRDAQIAKLESSLQSLRGDVEALANQTNEQTQKLLDQEKKLNTAYYMFGTSGELKDAKVISGGFLRSTKILTDGIETSKFISIDIRNVQEIPVFSKKAKLLSDHPEDSYAFSKDQNDNIVIDILDYTKFWSFTRFLIVQIG